jgi:hypothetical protein
LYCNPVLHPSDNDSSNKEANSNNECIIPAQPAVQIRIYGTAHMGNHLASKSMSNDYFDIINDEINL